MVFDGSDGHGGHTKTLKSPVFLGFLSYSFLRRILCFLSWLGCQDSNLGMTVSKTVALPLGDTPIERKIRAKGKGQGEMGFKI